MSVTSNTFSAGTWHGQNKVVINEIYSHPNTDKEWDDGNIADSAPVPSKGQSIARFPNSHDTIPDNDLTDFKIDTTPTRGTENM